MMPYYGMPVGTAYEEVGFGFNRSVITGLLRERLGFDGVVCTDWGLLTDAEIFGQPFPARAWGVEHLSPRERMKKVLEAGADQFGGEACPELLIELVESGEVEEERLDRSARRILREKFELGLFESALVDVEAADVIVGSDEFRAAGEWAQRASITLLKNGVDGAPLLPLQGGVALYVEGIDASSAQQYGRVVSSPEEADVIVVRLQAPYEERPTVFESLFHSGSLEFPAEVIEHVRELGRHAPTVVDVYADRPAILEPIVAAAAAVTVNWGASAEALLDVLAGRFSPRGRLPFDLPRSMAAVEAARPDVPFDTADPLFRFGDGLTY
jgi:beta-glucosidase